jgi:hypothetical protein
MKNIPANIITGRLEENIGKKHLNITERYEEGRSLRIFSGASRL